MKTTAKQTAINKAAKMNEQANNNGIFGKRYTVAEDIRTGKYVVSTMSDILNSQYLKLAI